MMTEDLKKYFIKDEDVKLVDDDRFRHIDYAENIVHVIETETPPCNIALIGKWGLGKTSLLNLVQKKVKDNNKKSGKIDFITVNAWKYEKEALRKVILKNVWLKADPDAQKRVSKEMYWLEAIKKAFKDEGEKKSSWTLKTWLLIASVFILGFLLFWLYKWGVSEVYSPDYLNELGFWRMVVNFAGGLLPAIISPAVIAFCAGLIYNKLREKTPLIELPLETEDDYESYAKEALAESKLSKLVIIIDDLDRLSSDKIVEALDAIKAFVDMPKCLFIIPFDDAILKEALESKKRATGKQTGNPLLDSELILDKLFQFKVYLPPLLFANIKEYAIKLAENNLISFRTKCNITSEEMQKIVKQVLIHSGVKTPRQVKKLLNAFVGNYMIAQRREQLNTVEGNLLTSLEGKMQIAKISVLQTDFNEFYDLLFTDYTAIDSFLKCYNSSEKCANENIESQYFTQYDNGNGHKLKPEYNDLIGFLSKTITYRVDNIEPFLYLSQSSVSARIGDKNYNDFRNALTDKNEKRAIEILTQHKSLLTELENLLDNLDAQDEELENALVILINNFTQMMDNGDFAELLLRKCREVEAFNNNTQYIAKLSSIEVVNLYLKANASHNRNSFFEAYMDSLKNLKTSTQLGKLISAIIENISSIDSILLTKIKGIVRFAVNECCEHDDLVLFINAIDKTTYDTLFDITLMERYIDGLSKTLDDSIVKIIDKMILLSLYETNIDKVYSLLLPFAESNKQSEYIDRWFTNEICNELTVDTTTELAEIIIKNWQIKNGDKDNNVLFNLLNRLKYNINDENAEKFDKFTIKFISTHAMKSVLKYCCEKGFWGVLSSTGKKLLEIIFDIDNGEKNLDELKICIPYFTDEQQEEFIQKINSEITVVANKDYSILLNIVKSIAECSHLKTQLDAWANQLMSVPQFSVNSNYMTTYRTYIDFVCDYFTVCKSVISDGYIENYVDKVCTFFTSYSDLAINIVWNISDILTDYSFGNVFTNVKDRIKAHQTNADKIFDIVKANHRYFNKESGNLGEYVQFLFDAINLVSNPNSVIIELNSRFSSISKCGSLIELALEDEHIEFDTAKPVIAKFLLNENLATAIDDVFRNISEENHQGIVEILNDVKPERQKEILLGIIDKLDDATDLNTVTSVFYLIKEVYLSLGIIALLNSAKAIFIIAPDETETISMIINDLVELKPTISKEDKQMVVDILYKMFKSTNSEKIKSLIMGSLVKVLKISRDFKKVLSKDDDLKADTQDAG